MLTIQNLLISMLPNPSGITELPLISYHIESSLSDTYQTSYQLQIATDGEFHSIVYDSGYVKSENSIHITPTGFCMESATKYYVRVRITDNHQRESDYSKISTFLTGILKEDDWKASFVSGEELIEKDDSGSTIIRKTFHVHKKIKEAFAFTTAQGLYHFYMNGHKVGTDELAPGWTSYHNRLLYQTHDVTDLLMQGDNAFAAFVGAGWYKGKMGFLLRRNNYGERTAFFAQLIIRYEDGTCEWIGTDETCVTTHGPVSFSEIYDGEIYDASLEQNGFSMPDFKAIHATPVSLVPTDYSVLIAQPGGKVTRKIKLPAKRLFTTPAGDTVLDFGQNLSGYIETTFQSIPGEVLKLECFETLDSEGNCYFDNLRTAKQSLTYHCANDELVTYHPYFTFQGFRYAKVSSFPGQKPDLSNFTAYALYSDMEQTGYFTTSNQDINRLYENILWSLRGNFVDIPSDCPQRDERMGWTGDAQIFCRTACYLMNTYTFFSKWLKDVAADQTPDGGVPHVVPDIITGVDTDDWLVSNGTHSAAAWGDVAVINPYTLYLMYGDTRILSEQYDSMKAWINFMRNHSKDGIWTYRLQFGDWVALDAEEGSYFGATPTDFTCTAFYAYSTLLFAKTAKILGFTTDYEEYSNLYKEIVTTFEKTFFTEEGNLTVNTQTAHIVALYFDLVPSKYKKQVTDSLLKLLKENNGHLVTGFIGTPYFCHVLSQNGHTKEAYELLLKDDFPSWLYQVKMGATTIWEHWDGLKPDGTMWSPDMNSFNHYAYGAIGEWLFRVVAGIEFDESAPGGKHMILYPHYGGNLTKVDASYLSVYGKVSCTYIKDRNKVTLSVTVPANTTATVCLDGAQEMLNAPNNISFLKDSNCLKTTIGSGDYTFEFLTLSE